MKKDSTATLQEMLKGHFAKTNLKDCALTFLFPGNCKTEQETAVSHQHPQRSCLD